MAELITNGTFDANISGWTNKPAHPWTIAEWSNGAMRLAVTASAAWCSMYQALSLVSGQVYRVQYDVTSESYLGKCSTRIEDTPLNSSVFGYAQKTLVVGHTDVIFTCSRSGTAYFDIECYPPTTVDFTIDNISIQHVGPFPHHLRRAMHGGM